MPLAQQLEALAIDIAREAGELARRRRTEGVAIAATKSSIADIVTEADREVETLIRDRLAAARPGDGFLGEESGAARGTTDITWVVDPIDGTVNYAYGIPAYAYYPAPYYQPSPAANHQHNPMHNGAAPASYQQPQGGQGYYVPAAWQHPGYGPQQWGWYGAGHYGQR
jgi:fructose-1,6-bisphosphatase/inositol monophosphatase family enzyme